MIKSLLSLKKLFRVLTVVMLSRDKVSGVSDDEVLLRCAVFLIFLLAACTMFATKRDELSLCEL